MKTKTILFLLIAVFLFSAASLQTAPLQAASSSAAYAQDITIVILHTNDIHGNAAPHINKKISPDGEKIGGMAYIAAYVDKERKQYPNHVLLLDAGDRFQGTAVSNIFRGKVMVDIMNQMRYDATTLGNHEFDWGQDVLRKRLLEDKFPTVCANAVKKNGEEVFPEVKPYIIKEIDGVKIAILGVVTPETPVITMPSNVTGIVFEDPVKVFNRYYPILKGKGVNIIIVLSHLGFDADKKLVSSVKGIDLIIGGHQHIPLNKPYYSKTKRAIVTQAGCYGEYLGKMVLTIDKASKKIMKFTPLEITDKKSLTGFTDEDELILIKPSDIAPDKKTELIISRYENLIRNKMEEVLAENKSDLVNQKKGKEDIALGNFICDIMRAESGSDMAFQNAGGIRESLYKGKIKVKDVYACLPFDNLLVTMTLTGKQILGLLNNAFGWNRRGMYFSGLQITYDPAGRGEPVGQVFVENKKTGKFEPLDMNKKYKIATNNFLAEGGDDYKELKEGKNLTYGKVLRDVVGDYLRKQKVVDYKFESRIKKI